MMSNYGYKKKSVPVIFEPTCKFHSTLYNIPEERISKFESSFQKQNKRSFKLCGL